MSQSEMTWFITGIVFIVLFGISLMAMCYLGYLIYSGSTTKVKDSHGQYQKAVSNDIEVEALDTGVTR